MKAGTVSPARLTGALLLALIGALAIGAAPARADFGIQDLGLTFRDTDGSLTTQAGSHPGEMTTSLGVTTRIGPDGEELAEGEVKDLRFEMPPGFAGDRAATPYCSTADFIAVVEGRSGCPDASAVGIAAVKVGFSPIEAGAGDIFIHVPVYNLPPAPGYAAKLGFVALNVPITVNVGLSQDPPYRIVATSTNIPQAVIFYDSELTLWGNPASPVHDPYRGQCLSVEVIELTEAPVSRGDCPVSIPEKPFLTMPRSCTGPLRAVFSANSWKEPQNTIVEEVFTLDDSTPPNPIGLGGCAELTLSPEMDAQPTSRAAESPMGLEFELGLDDEGLTSVTGTAKSDLKKVVVTLPEGLTVNPSSAEGLEVCGEADLARETLDAQPGEGCPDASKLGVVEVTTPLLDETLRGSLYLAEPHHNPFDSLLALYVVIKDPGLGILVKQAGKVEPDPHTGRLVTTFDDLPQVPLSSMKLRFREGARSPLVTPPRCGTYSVKGELTPWANPASPVAVTSSFEIATGVGGGACPQGGTPPFEPAFQAGTNNNNAGSYSPFYMRLSRRDGDQDLTRFSAELPPGMVARLAGTNRCSDAAIDAAKGNTGLAELASPSCPADSQIGRVMAGAGVGAVLTYVPGKVYLAGPYNGAPLSVVSVVPAVAGPFDVGTVVTRLGLRINPRSTQVLVDGAASDPIPHILAGIPLKVRDVRVYVDKPDFTLNPTSCEPSMVGALLWGGGADAFSSADDLPFPASQHFEAANCAHLGFRPVLDMRLRGGTKRSAHPALRAEYRPRPGDANLKGLVLRLPHSAFLDQGHIRTICTRVQFAAKACPAGAVYGYARAWTPLLDQPLEGPVYLRSSSNPLPDFVADLHGLIDVEAVARIDSKNGGIRATFTDVPDAPLSKVVVSMQGGKKGLIVNSIGLCRRKQRANAQFSGHNGRRFGARPLMRAACKGQGKPKRSSATHR